MTNKTITAEKRFFFLADPHRKNGSGRMNRTGPAERKPHTKIMILLYIFLLFYLYWFCIVSCFIFALIRNWFDWVNFNSESFVRSFCFGIGWDFFFVSSELVEHFFFWLPSFCYFIGALLAGSSFCLIRWCCLLCCCFVVWPFLLLVLV